MLDIKGGSIPKLGFGTHGMPGGRLRRVLVAALKNGFRHIDTAQIYQNEDDAGMAIREAEYRAPRYS